MDPNDHGARVPLVLDGYTPATPEQSESDVLHCFRERFVRMEAALYENALELTPAWRGCGENMALRRSRRLIWRSERRLSCRGVQKSPPPRKLRDDTVRGLFKI